MRLDLVYGARPQLWVVLSRHNLLSLLRATDVAHSPFSIKTANARKVLEGNPEPAPDWHLSVIVDPNNYEDGARLRLATSPNQTGAGRVFVDIGRNTIQDLLTGLDSPDGRRDYAVATDATGFGWQLGIHLEDDETHYAGRRPGDVSVDDPGVA